MRWLRKAAAALGVAVVFVVALVAGVVIHLDAGPARGAIARAVTAALAPSLRGRIVIERIGGLGLFGLGGTDARIEDARGVPVLIVHGASVRWMTWTAARSLLFESKAPLFIRLGSVSIDGVEAILDSDADGQLYLAKAFEPRTPSPPDPRARGLRLEIGRLTVRHLWAHGTPPGAPPVDADVDAFEGGLVSAPDRFEATIEGATLLARRIANGADVHGALAGRFVQPSDPRANVLAQVEWKGLVGRIGHSLRARLADRRVDATVDVPAIDPADLHAVLPEASLGEGASFRAEAHGPLSRVAMTARGSVGRGTVAMGGEASVGDDKTVDVRFDLRDIDAHAIAPSAPASAVGAQGEVHAKAATDGTLTGALAVRFLGGPVAGHRLPPIAIAAKGDRTGGDVHADATIDVLEPAAPTHVTLKVAPRGHGALGIDATFRSDVAQLDAVPALNHQATGEVHVTARGSLDVTRMVVEAAVDLRGRGLATGATRIDTLALEATASGPVADPRLTLGVRSQGVVAAGKSLTLADIDATGRASAVAIHATVRSADLPDVDGDLHVSLRPAPSVDDVRLVLSRAGERARATVRHAAIDGGTTRVDGVRVEGLGQPLTGSFAMSGQALRVRASSEGIDLGRVGRLAAMDRNLRSGVVAIDADVDVQRGSARGHARVGLTGGNLYTATGVELQANLDLAGRKFTGSAHAAAQDVGVVDLNAKDLEVAGAGPLLAASWRQIAGTLGIEGHVDLARASALVPADDLPFDEARGQVTLKAQVRRDDLDDLTPDVDLAVSTENLVFAPKTRMRRDIDGVVVIDPPSWRLYGIDVALDGHVDGDTGAIDGKTALHDKKGELMNAAFRVRRFPYADLFRGTPGLRAALTDMPVEVDATVPSRGLGGLPNILKQSYVSGKLEGDLRLRGSARMPVADLRVALKSSHFSQISNKEVLDLEATTHYDGARGKLTIRGVRRGQPALDVDATFEARAAQVLAGGSPAWTASARARFSKFPLEAVPLMDEKLVSGQIDGDLEVTDLHRDASAKAALSIEQLKVGTATYKKANVTFDAGGRDLHGQVRIEQDDGFAQSEVNGVASWGAALTPVLDAEAPLDVDLSAKNFRISVLLPFVEGTIDELDGRLDASTHLELDPSTRRTTLSGEIALDKGLVEAAAGGGELHDVTARVKFAPDGTITLEKLSAAGLSGRVEANGSARFDGTRLQSARGVVVIPSQSPIPLSGGGTEIGNVDGRIELASATLKEGRGLDLKVVVPHVRVALPTGSTNNAAGLKPMQDGIHIGAHRGRTDSFVVIPLDPAQPKDAPDPSSGTHIATELRDVQVVRGTDIAVDLGGSVSVDSGPTTSVTGTIHLKQGGRLTVQGKKFTIESGTVSFGGGDASNPEIVVKAGYVARDGTVVYANFVGPLKTGKVTLSSDPALPQEEIVQLLLFGSADGAQASNASNDPATSAIGTVGGEAAQPLNHLLNQWGLGAVSVNIDTKESSTPKPEIAIQIARDISLQLAIVLGQPPPGVNPDTTLVTLDWHFASRWSLAATVGDAGTTIFDLLWRKRY